jgi:hypothetical protein
MNEQPWKFDKKQVLARVRSILESGGYIRVSNGHDTVVLDVGNNPNKWDVDMHEWSEDFSIMDGVATIDIDDDDLVAFAEELGGQPFTDEEIDAELAAISEGTKQQQKEFERGRFP